MGGFDWNLDSDGDDRADAAGGPQEPSLFERLGFDTTPPSPAPDAAPTLSSVSTNSVPIPRPTAEQLAAPVIPPLPSRRDLRDREQQQQIPPRPLLRDRAASSRPGPSSSSRPSDSRPARGAAPTRTARGTSSSRPASKLRRRILPKLVSLLAMLGAGALVVSTSLPANAFFTPDSGQAPAVQAHLVAQSLQVDTKVVELQPTRDAYTVESLQAKLQLQFSNPAYSYTNDVNGTIQWPFPVEVPISSGFGARNVPDCNFCSTFHEGVDFVPGAGVTIDAIADGVVSETGTTGAFGNHVMIDHVINGQKVQSLYAHMINGSIKVTVGQQVTVTQPLGLVGSTGDATGPHLHLEIHLDGTPVDPFAWLKANAN